MRWTTRDGVVSWRLRGLVFLCAHVTGAILVLLLFAIPAGSVADGFRQGLVAWTAVAGMSVCSALESLAWFKRRGERRLDEARLLAGGAPRRQRYMSWRKIGVVSLVVGLPGVLLFGSLVLFTVLLIIEPASQPRAAEITVSIVAGAWAAIAGGLMARQRLKQWRSDRGFWPMYRAWARDQDARRPRP
jgi:hypothetical protein